MRTILVLFSVLTLSYLFSSYDMKAKSSKEAGNHITVDFDKKSSPFKLSEVFDNISYTVLETTNMSIIR
jgi:hypothetical protein